MKEVNPRYYYAAAGLLCGIIGGTLCAVVRPWLAWGIAGAAMAVLPLPGKKRTVWTFLLQLGVMALGAGIVGQVVYMLMSEPT